MDVTPKLAKHVLTTAIYDLIEGIQETFAKLMFDEAEPAHVAINNLLELWLLFTRRVVSNPEKLADLQTQFWEAYLLLCQDLNTRLTQNPYALKNAILMGFIEKFYFLVSSQVLLVIKNIFLDNSDDENAKQQIAFYNRQFIEAFSLNNFINSNLEALYSALSTNQET